MLEKFLLKLMIKKLKNKLKTDSIEIKIFFISDDEIKVTLNETELDNVHDFIEYKPMILGMLERKGIQYPKLLVIVDESITCYYEFGGVKYKKTI